MSVRSIETPVLVVGAGPVGLALACELGWRGVPCLVIDQGDGSVGFPAGEAIFVRTMEHLRRWGIADRVHASGFPQDYPRNVVFCTRLMGHLLARFERDSSATARARAGTHSPETAAFCPKVWFDPMLREFARSHAHVQLEYGWRLDGFEQDAEGVTARLVVAASGERIRVRSRYLAACDGAKSSVRRALGIEFDGVFAEGHNLGIYLRSKDLLARQPHGIASQFLTMSTRHRSSLTTVNGHDLWRLSLYVQPGEAETLDPAECVRDAFGDALDVEIIRAQPWSGHRVVARAYRKRRVFLVGDAAHMLWPKGGFGANTGIGDAVDLGWKLEAVLSGWGGERLLESYDAERRPIGVRNVEEAASNRAADGELPSDPLLEADGPAGEAMRAQLRDTILATRWKEWNTLGVQLGYRYASSPVIVPDGTPQPPDEPSEYLPSTWPGCRAPHAWLAPGRSMLDLYGRGWVLLRFGADSSHSSNSSTALAAAAQRAGMPLQTVDVADPDIARLYAAPLVLVRPDGHVAWRGREEAGRADAVIARVRGAGEAHAANPVAAQAQAQLQDG